MALRVTAAEIRAVIDYDDAIPIDAFITAANALTDYVSSQDSDSLLSAALLKEIERYLAAHFYESRDPQYTSRSTGGASGNFQGQFKTGLESSKWGQHAMVLDVTGTLRNLNDGKQAAPTLTWLGLAPSEQTDYIDRD
jgi:hypothetical protein